MHVSETLTYLVANCEGHKVLGKLMFDKMKLKDDLYWNSSDNKLIAIAETQDGSDKLLAEDETLALFNAVGEKDDSTAYQPASYVNLWRLRTTQTSPIARSAFSILIL